MTPYDVAEYQQCASCRTPHTLFVDFSQGDTICRECGLVHSEKLIYDGPEWTEYNNEDGSERPSVVRASGIVDETKWKGGGLEPTHLGKVFGPCTGDAQRFRKRLNKVKRNVDFYFEKEYETKLKESKISINLKKRKATDMSKLNDYNHNIPPEEDEDYTDLGTNEHERIITEEAEQEETLQHILISQKWSLDRAILLHGSTEEVPSYDNNSGSRNPNEFHSYHARDLEAERKTLRQAMDASQLKASEDLYIIYKMVEQALQRLQLRDNLNVFKDVMTMICRYASIKGSFQVRGVGIRCDKSRSEEEQEEERQEDKERQMGSLACAFIFLYCKKNCLGRALIDICSSFRSTRKRNHHPHDEQKDAAEGSFFIRAKHCSKALSEIRLYFPDYVQSATNTVHENRDQPDCVRSSNKITSTNSTTTTFTTDRQSTNLSNMVMHGARHLSLPSAAMEVIVDTVFIIHGNHCAEDVKPSVTIAAATFFICQIGEIMQRLSLQILKKNSIQDEVEADSNSSVSHRQVVTPEPEPFDILSHSSEQNETFQNESCWFEWRSQQPWARDFNNICTSFHAIKSSTLEFYRNHVYLKRKEILHDLKQKSSQSLNKSRLSVMLVNIDAAASLLKASTK